MALFEPAFNFTMDNEDRHRTGKVTSDAGGKTRFGIAQKWHHELPEDFYTMPADDALAIAANVYRSEYWRPVRGSDILDQRVASKCFDLFVNLPPIVAAKIMQGAAIELGQKIPCDGKMGGLTVCAINQVNADDFLMAVCAIQAKHYQEHGDQTVIAGLLNRANAVPA
jgi:lysozyme family protein